jgi:hypothetical protein
MKGHKSFMKCFSDFMADPEGLTNEDFIAELGAQGIDVGSLEERVAEISRRGSEERRLAWRSLARQRRAEIENVLKSKRIGIEMSNLEKKIKEILEGSYGQGALSYAEAYFRKRDSVSEKDMESLVEDLEDLNLLEKANKGEE